MAKLSITIWMIQVLFLLYSADAEENSSVKDLQNAAFECSMEIDDDVWKMRCESKEVNGNAQFYIVKLQGVFKSMSPIFLNELLNSSSISESEFYSCESMLRFVIRFDPSTVNEHCKNFKKHSRLSINALNESSITSLKITHTPNIKYVMNIFQVPSGLKDVRIYQNYLPDLPVFPFYSNNSIITLILKQNQVKRIMYGAFSEFPALKMVDLSNNFLSHINKSSFSGLTTLLTLDLSHNLIETISNDTLSDMLLLENVYLQNNNLEYINENIFEMNKQLQVLDISNNYLKVLPPKIFHSLSDLTNISCSNCSLISLDKDIFKYSPKLKSIIFNHNDIQVVPDKIFENQIFLRYVNLGFNRIKEISRNVFQHQSYLRFLNLKNNEISSLQKGTFDGAPYIYWLDMSMNELKILTDEDIKSFPDLEHFDLRQNKIVMVELGFLSNVFIRRLFLSDNLISKLNIRWKRMVFLEALNLNNNQLTSIDLPPCIPSVKQTVTISLRNNRISRLNLDSLIEDEIRVNTNIRMMAGCFFNGGSKNFIDLTHNPLLCDCNLYPFYNYIKEKVSVKHQLDVFLNKDNLTCGNPQYLQDKMIVYLKDDDFSCPFSEDCPLPCICGIRGKDNMLFVNCSGQSLHKVPQGIPERTTILYFNWNKLHSMKSLNLKIWENLTELHIDYNSIKKLDNWNYPESLRYLSVRGNKLKTLPSSLMNFISNQTNFQLYFGDNDKNCSCDRHELKNFLREKHEFIMDTESILCEVTNNGTAAYLPLVSVPDSELCSINSEGLNYSQKEMLICLTLFFTFFILVLLTYYKHRQLILSFFYVHCDIMFRLCYREDEYDEDKIFDAFVAYSSSDRDIVMDLLQELENHPPFFNLCIHERNWVPGRFICDNILSSVESSKRTIILLSDSFITSPWFNLELRAAVSKMSKDKISRIIMILTEKTVSLCNVDPELRHVISKRTYLVWNERWFWEKLRYAMPRKKPIKGNGAMANYSDGRISDIPLLIEA